MHKFEYRAPRFNVDLAIKLNVQNSTLRGRCRNISEKGMKLELCEPLPADTRGTIQMTYLDQPIEVDIRVAHTGSTYGGVEFVYKSESERVAVMRLVASSVSHAKRPRLVVPN
jgi:hypothetical protein